MAVDYQLTPKEQKKVDDAVNELVDSMVREQGEKDLRSDICSRIKEEVGFKSGDLNDLAKERYKSFATENIEKYENIVAFNEMLETNRKSAFQQDDSEQSD